MTERQPDQDPPVQDRQEQEDLELAVRAQGIETHRILRVDISSGEHQLVAVGPPPRGRPVLVAALLALALVSAAGFAVVYSIGGHGVTEGVLLGVSLLLTGIALIAWSKRLLPESLAIEQREPLDAGDHAALATDLARPELEQPGRRMLIGAMAGAGLFIVGAIAFPLRSLGPRPGNALARTSWRAGLRVVDRSGRPVHRDDIAVDAAMTVFPEGHTDAGDSQVMLMRVPHGLLSPATVDGGVVDGRVAYSKVCSHAGCPVGQFRVDSRPPDVSYELLCPCHQSLFDVLDGCRVLAGPAATPLPQLPLATDADGYLIATGDFPSPIGPAYWNRP